MLISRSYLLKLSESNLQFTLLGFWLPGDCNLQSGSLDLPTLDLMGLEFILSKTLGCFGMWFFEFLLDNPELEAVPEETKEEEIDLLTVSLGSFRTEKNIYWEVWH